VRKEDFVQPYYRHLKGAEGIACVLTSMEQGRTFVSYTPPSGDPHYRLIKACRKQFLHYYWYALDPVMGPMSVRVAGYFPFNVTCFFNGHSFVAEDLIRAGIRFRKADNAFLGVADVASLQAAADRLSAAILERRCSYWVRRLVPTFTPSERAALPLAYRYSMAQMELATDIIFKRSAPLKALFQRACELGVLVGGACRPTAVERSIGTPSAIVSVHCAASSNVSSNGDLRMPRRASRSSPGTSQSRTKRCPASWTMALLPSCW
jgi:hypothetical protein